MRSKYDFLKKYINNQEKPPRNWFGAVSIEEIEISEKKIGYKFPESLKEFWLEIGYGVLDTSNTSVNAFSYSNIILKPSEIASIILMEEDMPMLLDYREDYIQDGDIPFFEIADLSSYLFMNVRSDDPLAIYNSIGEKIEKDLETFIRKLYYKSPVYYLWIGEEENDPYMIKD